MKPTSRREAVNRLYGSRPRAPQETLTREHGKPARFNYELRTNTGAVLQGNDHLDSLLKYLNEKRGVVVVRTKDSEVVARSPELDS